MAHGLSDNSWAFQNFMKNVLDIKAELCQTHATAIAANNGTHRKYFKDDKKYEKFYEMLCDLMRITCEPAGYYLQSLHVQWLRANVDDRCAHWFETHRTGPVKRRYLLGFSGGASKQAGGGIAMHALRRLSCSWISSSLCTINMGIPLLRRHCVFMQNSISSRASQSSGVRSIPSNAIARTFFSGLAVTMDSCAPCCASQA